MTKNTVLRQHHQSARTILPSYCDGLLEARTQLTQQLGDLRRDEEPHNEVFWHAVLDDLHAVRTALSPELAVQAWEEQGDQGQASVSREYLQEQLGRADHLIDQTGIAVSTYLPVCDSRTAINVQKRQSVVATLLDLQRDVQQVLVCMRPICPHAALVRHTRCPHCGVCHYDQCEVRILPCTQVLAFTVEEQKGGEQLLVRFVEAGSSTLQTWTDAQGELLAMDVPFVAYREFLCDHPAAVYVPSDELQTLVARRGAEVKKHDEARAQEWNNHNR